MKTIDNQISFNPTVIACILGVIAVLLILAGIGGQLLRFSFGEDYLRMLVLLFHLDHERNIPTYFSVLLILFAALLLALIAALSAKQKLPHVSKWIILSCGFMYMAFDEAFQLHERLIRPISVMLGEKNLGIFYFAWVIPAMILVLILGLFFLKFLLHLPMTVRLRFLIAATLYLGGAIGIELIGGRHAELHGEENLTYSIITTIEESLEIAGLIFFIWALLKYCADHHKEVQFCFKA